MPGFNSARASCWFVARGWAAGRQAEYEVSDYQFPNIERQLVEALPEIAPAAAFYWEIEGEPGRGSGPYIFFEDLFARYVEVLLWLPSGSRRDELLRRAFAVVEQMLGSADKDVQELAMVGLYEGTDPAWLKRARGFVGTRGRAWLEKHHPCWSDCASANDQILPQILDGYHVRTVIARELQHPVDEVPGTTYAAAGLPDVRIQPTSGDGPRGDSKD